MLPVRRPGGSKHYSAVPLLLSQMAGWGEQVVLSLNPAFPAARTLPVSLAPVVPLGRTLWPRERAPESTARNTAVGSLTAFAVEAILWHQHDARRSWIACLLWCLGLYANTLTAVFPEHTCSAALSGSRAFPISAPFSLDGCTTHSVPSPSLGMSHPKSL